MSHSLVKVFIHYVWTTKNRERILVGDVRIKVKTHIAMYAQQNGIHIDALDVQPEHVHMLLRLTHDQRIEDVSKLLKGESSHWINQNDVVPGKFSWQTGYAAFSVSSDAIDTVRAYIESQDDHHTRSSFKEEVEAMLREVGYVDNEIAELIG